MKTPWTMFAVNAGFVNAGFACVDAHGNSLWTEWDAGMEIAEYVAACVNEVEQLRAENARLREALRVLADVADSVAITHNTSAMDAWIDKARAALSSDARTEAGK